MTSARPNPWGLPTASLKGGERAILVLVGKYGKLSHIYDPDKGSVICESGLNAGRYPDGATPEGKKKIRAERGKRTQDLYQSRAEEISCYRCTKLAIANVKAGRPPWKGP